MRLRFKVIEVGWGIDFDNNRHPRIRIGRRNWSAVLYDHPAEGWQVISLEIVCKAKRDTRTKEYDGDTAENKIRELLGGEMAFTNTNVRAIENDLYEVGQKGAAKRWVGKTITLKVDKAEPWHLRSRQGKCEPISCRDSLARYAIRFPDRSNTCRVRILVRTACDSSRERTLVSRQHGQRSYGRTVDGRARLDRPALGRGPVGRFVR